MNGLLVYENNPAKTLAQKVKSALDLYEKKRESRGALAGMELKKAEVCLVNPQAVAELNLDDVSKECGLIVKAYRGVTPNHFWVGYEDFAVKEKS